MLPPPSASSPDPMQHAALRGALLDRIEQTRAQVGTAWPYHADPKTGRWETVPHNGAMPIGHQVQVKSTTLASRRIVAVDNVHPNLRLDHWAYAETGDEVFLCGWGHFGKVRYRDAARATFDYWRGKAGTDVRSWDFDDPDGPRDTSASTIIVEQLARMAGDQRARSPHSPAILIR